jgi:hypothetical protein
MVREKISSAREESETNDSAERVREAFDAAREYLKEIGAMISISLPADMKEPSADEKKNLLDGIRGMAATLAGVAILAHASPAPARVREFSPLQKAPETTELQEEGLTFHAVDIPQGTRELTLQGSESSLPSKLPSVLEKTLPMAVSEDASGSAKPPKRVDSPFVLQEQRTEVRNGVTYRIGVYRTKDSAPLTDPVFIKIPYVIKRGVQPSFSLITDDDKRFTFGSAAVHGDLAAKSGSVASSGFYGEQNFRYPLSDDGNVQVEIGALYGTEHGTPGTTVHTPGKTGGDVGYKLAPSIGVSYTPSSLSEFALKMQPHFTEGTTDLAQALSISSRRPVAVLGYWEQRNDDPNWQELRIDGALEVNGDQFAITLPAPFSRAKARVQATQAFINPAWGLGTTVGGVLEHVRLPELGKDAQNPTHVGIRFGGVASIPESMKKNTNIKWLVDLLGDKELDFGATIMPGFSQDPTGLKIELDAQIKEIKKQKKEE